MENSLLARGARGVRIMKFRVRVIPQILTKDPRPQWYAIVDLDPLAVRVRNVYCPATAPFNKLVRPRWPYDMRPSVSF